MSNGATRNRHASPDPFDLKQRAVGGVVLLLIMFLLYYLLKAMLGIATTSGEVIRFDPLPDEMLIGQAAPDDGPLENVPPTRNLPAYLMKNEFIFLGLNGKPLGGRNAEGEDLVEDIGEEPVGGDGNWYVQVASFRDPDRARSLSRKIRSRELDSIIVEVLVRGRVWYAVRLTAQPSKREAERQQRVLEQMGIRRTQLRQNR